MNALTERLRYHVTGAIERVLKEFVYADEHIRHYAYVERAVKVKAERVADAEFARTMAHFYTERVLSIDPHAGPAEAWDFADAKQKQYDYQRDALLHNKRVDEATKKAEARMAQYQRALQR